MDRSGAHGVTCNPTAWALMSTSSRWRCDGQ
jgi:hypothetical protein